jgi:hypothetical protein
MLFHVHWFTFIIIITTTIIIISGTTAQIGAILRYYGSIAEVNANEDQVASLMPQCEF